MATPVATTSTATYSSSSSSSSSSTGSVCSSSSATSIGKKNRKNSSTIRTTTTQQQPRMQPLQMGFRSVLEIMRRRFSNSNDSAAKKRQKRPSTSSSVKTAALAQLHQQPATVDTNICQLCLFECLPLEIQSDNTIDERCMYRLDTQCAHSFCVSCLRLYLRYQITESRVNISCPQCPCKMHPNDIYRLLSSSSSNISSKDAADMSHLIHKYEEFMLRRVLVTIPDTRWCPAPDCTYAVIASGCANCPQLVCGRPGCNTSFCYHCKQLWHPNVTCEDAALRATLGSAFYKRSNSTVSVISVTRLGDQITPVVAVQQPTTSQQAMIRDEIKRCPKCGALIVKMDDGSCNHITCAVCGCEFCWLCMKEISDLHYLSPSGCTFWGKKPWSRKKKILWQLGTLIGAPIGIALIAGVAVPAIIIGLPIWVGRKVYVRYKNRAAASRFGRHSRNLIVAGTVICTLIVAPVVAALAVAIGVPILLAYVYGVVPISLCRSSGGCGVTKNNNGGVRLAFDDEIESSGGGVVPNTIVRINNSNNINNNNENTILVKPTTTTTSVTTINESSNPRRRSSTIIVPAHITENALMHMMRTTEQRQKNEQQQQQRKHRHHRHHRHHHHKHKSPRPPKTLDISFIAEEQQQQHQQQPSPVNSIASSSSFTKQPLLLKQQTSDAAAAANPSIGEASILYEEKVLYKEEDKKKHRRPSEDDSCNIIVSGDNNNAQSKQLLNANNKKDFDTKSSSADEKSINPSVVALAGSIKDNQSVDNLSNNNSTDAATK